MCGELKTLVYNSTVNNLQNCRYFWWKINWIPMTHNKCRFYYVPIGAALITGYNIMSLIIWICLSIYKIMSCSYLYYLHCYDCCAHLNCHIYDVGAIITWWSSKRITSETSCMLQDDGNSSKCVNRVNLNRFVI